MGTFLFSNLSIENKSGESPERTFTKEAAKRQNGGSNEITVSGRRIEKQRLSRKRDCAGEDSRWEKSGSRLFYHGKKLQQPQPDLCSG